MKKILWAAAAGAAFVAMAPAANAAVISCPTAAKCTFSEADASGNYFATLVKNTAFDTYYSITLSDTFDFTVSLTSSTDTSVINFTTRALLDSGFATLGTFTSDGIAGGLTKTLTSGIYYVHLVGATGSKGSASYSGTLDIAPVPEPATWALMIVGIATVGTAMRRRSATAATISFS